MKESTGLKIKIAVTWLFRIVVGATFAFSGFVKAIDPWGTLYKFQDYMGAMGLPNYDNLLLTGVFFLCAYEFCVGIFLITGCFRRSTPIAGMLMMAVMLPLTLWIYIADPVPDCGCFGDAILLSNSATFWKNVALVIMLGWLIKYNTVCRCLIRPLVQWIALLSSTGLIFVIGLIGYVYQPLIDFRPFKAGTVIADNLALAENNEPDSGEGSSEYSDDESFDLDNISDGESSEDDNLSEDQENDEADDMLFIYEKDGVEKGFSINDELPDENDGWKFVRRESKSGGGPGDAQNTALKAKSEDPASLQIWSEDGNEEVTQDVLLPRGGQLLLLMPDLKNVSVAMTWRINSLHVWAKDNDIDMIGVVAGTPQDIAYWKDISLASYPLYTAEDTSIKMLARGNPAVVYLYDGKIIWKSSLRALDTEDFQASGALKRPSDYARDDEGILKQIIVVYAIIMGALIFLSLLPLLVGLMPKKLRTRVETRDAKIKEVETRRADEIKQRISSGKSKIEAKKANNHD